MTRSAGLIVLVAAAALVVALVFVMDDDRPRDDGALGVRRAPEVAAPADGALPEPVAARDAQPSRLDAPLAAPDTTPPADAAPADTRAQLRGRVLLRDQDTPVPDVLVELRSQVPNDPDFPRRARTDEHGAYAFSFPDAVALRSVFVGAGASSSGTMRYEAIEIAAGETRELELRVPAGARLAGVVRDVDGHPVPNVEVRLWSRRLYELDDTVDPDRTWRADDAGRFDIPALGAAFVLDAQAPGFAAVRRLHGSLEPGARHEGAELLVDRTVDVRGRVRTSAGPPVAAADVRLQDTWLDSTEQVTPIPGVFRAGPAPDVATTDADGVFALQPAARGPRRVRVEHAEFPALDRGVTLDGEPLELVLEQGGALSGLVFGADGAPVADAQVRIEGAGRRSTRTDDEGAFVLVGLSASADARLYVRAAGHAVHVEQPVKVPATGTGFVELDLAREFVLAGVLVDPQGAPVPDATLSLEGDRIVDMGHVTMIPVPTWERSFGVNHASTDDAGRFRFEQLYDGAFTLSVAHPDDPQRSSRWELRSGRDDLRLVLDPESVWGVSLVGRVTDARTGEPVPEFSITPMRPGPGGGLGGTSRGFDDPDGRFAWHELDSGPMQINVDASGYAQHSVPLAEYDEGEHVFDIALRELRSLHLRVVDGAGTPMPEVRVGFAGEEGEQLMVSSGPNSGTSHLTTDANGELHAYRLPAGRVTALVDPPGLLTRERPFEFDLWTPLEGVQTVVLDGAEAQEVTERALYLGVVGCHSGPPLDDLVTSERAVIQGFAEENAELVASGALWPLVVAGSLRFVGEDDVTRRAVIRPGPGGGWVVEHGDGETVSTGPDGLLWRLPSCGGLLELNLDGHAPRRRHVPPGTEDVMAMFLFVVQ